MLIESNRQWVLAVLMYTVHQKALTVISMISMTLEPANLYAGMILVS